MNNALELANHYDMATNTRHMINVGEPIVFITENWTGQQRLCPKFFICMSMIIFLLQGIGEEENFFTLNFICM